MNVVHHRRRLQDVSLHYVTAGSGEPIVLLHPWPQTWFGWRRVIPRLAEKYQVIAPDMRGLGDSSRPASGYEKRAVAADIHELMVTLGHERVRLVGHGVGGWVAYPYACMYPDEVAKLAMVQVVLPGYGLEEKMDNSFHFRFHMELDIPEALIAGREHMYLDRFLSGGVYDRSAITPEALAEYVRCCAMPGALRAGFNYYRTLPQDARDNEEFAKRKLSIPVLAVGGEFADGDGVRQSVECVATSVTGAVVAGCAHSIPEERPQELADLILKFFDE